MNKLLFGRFCRTADLLTSVEIFSGLVSGDLPSYFIGNNLLNVEVTFNLFSGFYNMSDKGKRKLQVKFVTASI